MNRFVTATLGLSVFFIGLGAIVDPQRTAVEKIDDRIRSGRRSGVADVEVVSHWGTFLRLRSDW